MVGFSNHLSITGRRGPQYTGEVKKTPAGLYFQNYAAQTSNEARGILEWPVTIWDNLHSDLSIVRDLAKGNAFKALVIMVGGTYILAPRAGVPLTVAGMYLLSGWFVESSNL